MPAGSSSVTITNSFILSTSQVVCTPQQIDASGAVMRAVTVSSGSATIVMSMPVTAATQIACLVFG
jgi:hypothetical protein